MHIGANDYATPPAPWMNLTIEEWGPAPWMDPDAFFILRMLWTGISGWIAVYTIFSTKEDSVEYPFNGHRYLTHWGMYGTWLCFMLLWTPYTLRLWDYQPLPSFVVDWLNDVSVYMYQCLLIWEIIITAVYWVGIDDPYTDYTLEVFMSGVGRHILPLFCLTMDFAFSSMRFTGFKTWLNMGLSIWAELMYVFSNFAYNQIYADNVYYFLDWTQEPLLAGIYSVVIVLANFPLWYLAIAISSLKDSYWVEKEALIHE